MVFESLVQPISLIGLIPGFDLVEYITTLGIVAILFVIFAESGLLVGFFLPGDSLLFTAGVLTYAGTLNINIHLFVFLLFLAAVLGDSVGYTFGRKVGHKLFRKPNSLIFKQENIKHTQYFYEKHGGKTIIIARFIPVVRTFAPVVAGIGKMHYPRFLAFNIVGALLWAAGVTYLGYFLGVFFESMGLDIDTFLMPIIALIILISITPPIYHILKDKNRRTAIYKGIREQFRIIFKRKN